MDQTPAPEPPEDDSQEAITEKITRDLQQSEVLGELAPEQKERVIAEVKAEVSEHLVAVTQYKGPLPPPGMLAEYEAIVPGFARELLNGYTDQRNHRMSIERTAIGRQTWQSGAGQVYALIIGLSALGVGGWLVHENHDWAGTGIATGGLVSLAIAFLRGRSQTESDLKSKKQE